MLRCAMLVHCRRQYQIVQPVLCRQNLARITPDGARNVEAGARAGGLENAVFHKSLNSGPQGAVAHLRKPSVNAESFQQGLSVRIVAMHGLNDLTNKSKGATALAEMGGVLRVKKRQKGVQFLCCMISQG